LKPYHHLLTTTIIINNNREERKEERKAKRAEKKNSKGAIEAEGFVSLAGTALATTLSLSLSSSLPTRFNNNEANLPLLLLTPIGIEQTAGRRE
jgi:hypothetical protein